MPQASNVFGKAGVQVCLQICAHAAKGNAQARQVLQTAQKGTTFRKKMRFHFEIPPRRHKTGALREGGGRQERERRKKRSNPNSHSKLTFLQLAHTQQSRMATHRLHVDPSLAALPRLQLLPSLVGFVSERWRRATELLPSL